MRNLLLFVTVSICMWTAEANAHAPWVGTGGLGGFIVKAAAIFLVMGFGAGFGAILVYWVLFVKPEAPSSSPIGDFFAKAVALAAGLGMIAVALLISGWVWSWDMS